jgi:hypothetical protein
MMVSNSGRSRVLLNGFRREQRLHHFLTERRENAALRGGEPFRDEDELRTGPAGWRCEWEDFDRQSGSPIAAVAPHGSCELDQERDRNRIRVSDVVQGPPRPSVADYDTPLHCTRPRRPRDGRSAPSVSVPGPKSGPLKGHQPSQAGRDPTRHILHLAQAEARGTL